MALDYNIRPITVREYLKMGELGLIGPDERVAVARICHRRFADRSEVQCQLPVRLNEISEPEPDVVLLLAREDRYRKRRPTASDVLWQSKSRIGPYDAIGGEN